MATTAGNAELMVKSTRPKKHKSQSNKFHASITESLEQLANASQRLADAITDAAGLDDPNNVFVGEREGTLNEEHIAEARHTLEGIFSPVSMEEYDGSEAMESARVAYLNAALQMYTIVVDESSAGGNEPVERDIFSSENDVASRIGEALKKELRDFYKTLRRGNDRITFTTEQRNALESAFLLKPKLNTAEKRALAKTCNLNPRQVEVWVCAPFGSRSRSRPCFIAKQTWSADAILHSFRIVVRAENAKKSGWRSAEPIKGTDRRCKIPPNHSPIRASS